MNNFDASENFRAVSSKCGQKRVTLTESETSVLGGRKKFGAWCLLLQDKFDSTMVSVATCLSCEF